MNVVVYFIRICLVELRGTRSKRESVIKQIVFCRALLIVNSPQVSSLVKVFLVLFIATSIS